MTLGASCVGKMSWERKNSILEMGVDGGLLVHLRWLRGQRQRSLVMGSDKREGVGSDDPPWLDTVREEGMVMDVLSGSVHR